MAFRSLSSAVFGMVFAKFYHFTKHFTLHVDERFLALALRRRRRHRRC